MHHRECNKTTATGPLGLAALPNSELYVHGLRDAPLDLSHLHEEQRRVLVLFPSEDARPLSKELIAEDSKPVTLVVPDGNWRQASRVPRRIPGLVDAERVTLPLGPPSRWGVRTEPRLGGLATFEAIARAMGILESKEVQAQLEVLFDRLVESTFAARGEKVLPLVDSPSAENLSVSRQGELEAEPPLEILYQDEYLVAVNKPSGLACHRGWAHDGIPAVQRVRDQIACHVFPVHRLDRATSGVLVFALRSEIARDLQTIFKNEHTVKRYLAVCRGQDPDLKRVEHALAKEKGAEKREAVTDFRLLGRFERYGLYEALPRTGRTHQIRRHLKHVAHPIVGDVRYGKGEHNRIFRSRFGFHRLALHCHRMQFVHPRLDKKLEIEAPLDACFQGLLAELGLAERI